MVEQSSGADPLWPGPRDLAARLDRLEERLAELEGLRPAVESALVAQASRIEAVLSAARRDLAETTVGDHVRAALAGAAADAEDRIARVQAAVAASAAPLEALTGAVESLHGRLEQVVDEAAEDRTEVQRLVDEVGRLAGQHEPAMQQLRTATERAIDEVRGAADAAVAQVVERLEAAGQRADRAVAAIDGLRDGVREHLEDLERRTTVERARLTGAFVEQLADGLTRRERKRLAKRLEVPEPAPPPPADAPAEDSAAEAERAEAEPAGTAPVPPEPTPDPEPAPVTPPSTPPLRRVQPSRRSRPVRSAATAPQDPAALRRTLAAVRGLGQARQSALIDRFGTLEAVRDASDVELLEVRGIGPSLLPAIRDAVAGTE